MRYRGDIEWEMAVTERDEPELLTQALRSLPDDDRERVLAWMLRHLPVVADPFRTGLSTLAPELSLRPRRPTSAGSQQVVPIRFSSEELAQLRAWSEQHGFSMAAVVRGLVSRFLDGQPDAQTQQGGSAEAEPP
jgi:hypothetical protein